MRTIIGSWLMDVGKYVATAIIIGMVFKQSEGSDWYYWMAFGILATIMAWGVFLLRSPKTRKINNN
jgi:cytochrome b